MPFIGRRGDNSLYGCWTVQQWDGQEELPDTDSDVVAFLAPKPALDLSNVDNLEKGLKALALCVAQIGGLTGSQMRTLFKQHWDALP
jgi:hypothetical protein